MNSTFTGRYYVAGCLSKSICSLVNYDSEYIKNILDQNNSTDFDSNSIDIVQFTCCSDDLCNKNTLANGKTDKIGSFSNLGPKQRSFSILFLSIISFLFKLSLH